MSLPFLVQLQPDTNDRLTLSMQQDSAGSNYTIEAEGTNMEMIEVVD